MDSCGTYWEHQIKNKPTLFLFRLSFWNDVIDGSVYLKECGGVLDPHWIAKEICHKEESPMHVMSQGVCLSTTLPTWSMVAYRIRALPQAKPYYTSLLWFFLFMCW